MISLGQLSLEFRFQNNKKGKWMFREIFFLKMVKKNECQRNPLLP
jgi:hypothetical protein